MPLNGVCQVSLECVVLGSPTPGRLIPFDPNIGQFVSGDLHARYHAINFPVSIELGA